MWHLGFCGAAWGGQLGWLALAFGRCASRRLQLAPKRAHCGELRQQLIDVPLTMLCWLRCGRSCRWPGGRSCRWPGGLSCCWRGALLRHLNDGCLSVRNRPHRFWRLSGARCTRDRGLVVVFGPFLDRTRIVLTHHREERVGFRLGFDDT